MDLFGFDIVFVSLAVIAFSIFVIVLSLAVLFFFKSKEEKVAKDILLNLEKMRTSGVAQKPILEIKKEELSLKKLLIDKFKPIIEKQLKAKVEILDFNAKGETFLVLILAAGAKLLLVLDSSGKIIDYKKVK